METIINKHNTSGKKTLLIAISAMLTVISILSFIFHISPAKMIETLADFSRHHYFLMGFLSLTSALILLKRYLDHEHSQQEKIHSNTLSRSKPLRRRRVRVFMQNLQRTLETYKTPSIPVYIDKKEIIKLKISPNEILIDENQRKERKELLDKALSLGNVYKQKVIICFVNKEQKFQTLATIWHVDDENLCLKGGAIIPVQNIYKIEL